MTGRYQNASNGLLEPLAIVGMACRLPGADDLQAYWNLLSRGESGVREMPPERLNRPLFQSETKGQLSKSYTTISGLISSRANDPSSDLDSIDVDQVQWDPCHEILCGVVNEARENAGWSLEQLSKSRTGVYVGHSSGSPLGGELILASLIPDVAHTLAGIDDFHRLEEGERNEVLSDFIHRIQSRRPVRTAGEPKFDAHFAAQIVAQRLQLQGPQLVIDAACSSSLIALALASAALAQGEIEQAVVSSASYAKAESLILFSQAQSCSATGSRPFDAAADGLVNAEGYVALLVKTLARAEADGDNIQAVIRGIGISSDGRGRSLWAPRKEGQLQAIQRAFPNDVARDSVQYLEAHATSTQVGDVTELEALSTFYGTTSTDRQIPLGSVKSNLGHTLETAGLASILKCVLGMQHGWIPPTINLSEPNPGFDWTKGALAPVTELTRWPDITHQPRRSAISAFGIGGLNAHVIVDGRIKQNGAMKLSSRETYSKVDGHSSQINPERVYSDDTSIAIIGRGVIVAGAADLNQFTKLVQSGASQLSSPPAERWRDTPFWSTRPTIQRAYQSAQAGYIHGYKYDWRKHHIPPLQITHANPLQFMLLDAAQQALDESGYGDRNFDRSRAAVVVGTVFGGEFSHELQIGLRSPEIIDELAMTLQHRGWSTARIQKICAAAEQRLLEFYPAIKDQTGSFTSSTQASRIAKSLNVMGGAFAVDAGQCSGLAALQSAQHLLASRVVDFVFCAAAQRDLDAAGVEAWNCRTREFSQETSLAADGPPGEGVVVLLLRRVCDAQRENNPICGVIHQVHASGRNPALNGLRADKLALPTKSRFAHGSLTTAENSQLALQFGHLQAASGLLEILGLTVKNELQEDSPANAVVQTHTSECEYQAVYESPQKGGPIEMTKENHTTAKTFASQPTTASTPSGTSNHVASRESVPTSRPQVGTVRLAANDESAQIFRLWGSDEHEIRQRLQELTNTINGGLDVGQAKAIPAKAPYRLTIVSRKHELIQKLQIAAVAIDAEKSRTGYHDQGIFYHRIHSAIVPRMAAIFPGQGSHQTGMLLDLIRSSALAASMLERADQKLMQWSLPRCSPWITGEEALPDDDLQATQIAMLTANVFAFAAVSDWGLKPDYLLGHSFGEYAALVAAGVLEFEAAIAITIARAKAVASSSRDGGAMLSLAARVQDVRPLIAGLKDVFISHRNAPQQTVVAGTKEAIRDLSQRIKSAGVASIQIPVGSPFHTPLLEKSCPLLQIALEQQRWRPPIIPLLSSISGRFVADRDQITENLTRQLVVPVDWVRNVERLLAEDVQLFLEVGPGRVLTKLTRQIVAERDVIVLSLDDKSLPVLERRQRIQAAMETLGICTNEFARFDEWKTLNNSIPGVHSRQVKLINEQSATVELGSRDAIAGAQHENSLQQSVPIVPTNPSSLTPSASEENDPLVHFLIDIIVQQTGYPPDVIDLDWDLEADLGIDSIRKAQIFGELREYFDFQGGMDLGQLNEIRTSREILHLLQLAPGKKDWLDSTALTELNTDSAIDIDSMPRENRDEYESQAVIENIPLNSIADSHSTLVNDLCTDDFLIDFVIEKTGYPREVIELDADLEADLGIDSITRAQLIGEVYAHFQFSTPDHVDRERLNELRTLRQIRDQLHLSLREMNDSTALAGLEHRSNLTIEDQITESPAQSNLSATAQNVRTPERTSRSRRTRSFEEPVTIAQSIAPMAFERGQAWGRKHRQSVHHQLFDYADRVDVNAPVSDLPSWEQLSETEAAELRGIADGASVMADPLLLIRHQLKVTRPRPTPIEEPNSLPAVVNDLNDESVVGGEANVALKQGVTKRFRLEMSPPEIKKWSGKVPDFAGGAIVIGDDPDGDELSRRLESFGVTVSRIRVLGDCEENIALLESLWKTNPSPHLFIMTSRDAEASTDLDEAHWKSRRQAGVTSLYWFCQKWLGLVERSKLLDDASLVGVTALGGDFGISGSVCSAESGAITGLFKSIIIECWMNGHRAVPIKLLDFPTAAEGIAIVDAICVELTEPSYDVEIGWQQTSRSVLRCVAESLRPNRSSKMKFDGQWVVTGGARGITAYVVGQMAARYGDIHFHLVGTAPQPNLSERDRAWSISDWAGLRADVMRRARVVGQNAVLAWKDFEKQIEIDRTLSEFRRDGFTVTYHSCDVGDRAQLSEVLSDIRKKWGPINGVIHGAGIGRDAAFQRKSPKIVEQCLSAKIDGMLNLMALTEEDPLQALIGFGSISGRFGANGHTDYSLANDMLAKLACWYRQRRPEVPAAVFHWHAWDDIGMATKPDTRLALNTIGVQLMPATEGAQHFLGELEAGLPIAEVLITDSRYYRMFYPADRIVTAWPQDKKENDAVSAGALLTTLTTLDDGRINWQAALNPLTDPFLKNHRLHGRPLLPMVIMMELLTEAASHACHGQRAVALRELEIHASVKFPTDLPCSVRVVSTKVSDQEIDAELRADFRARNGKIVHADRLHAKAIVEFESSTTGLSSAIKLDRGFLKTLDWQRVDYPTDTAVFYVGGPLRCLRKYALDPDEKIIWGRINAPSLGELAGAERDISNWMTPSAVLDASLLVSGILAWSRIRPGVTLPQRIQRFNLRRLPTTAEICWVRSQLVDVSSTHATFDIIVWGNDDQPLFSVQNYVATWLSS